MIYLNHAATGYPKPDAVVEAMARTLAAPPTNALRSTAADADDLPRQWRQAMARVLHTAHHERITFTSGATDSLNRLIGGLGLHHAIVGADSHNSVLRPLYNLTDIHHVDVVATNDIDRPERWPEAPAGDTLLAVAHCANASGTIHDIPRICCEAHRRGFTVVVDAAQSAGCIPIDTDGWGIDAVAFTGHKALCGPPGTGGYYLRPGIALHPTLFGGTGRDSSIIRYADDEWEYEVGTPNRPGMAALKAGIDQVLHISVEAVFKKVHRQTQLLIKQLRALDRLTVYSPGGHCQGPIVSFNVDGLLPSDVGYMLENAYGITTRTGLHCAPLTHREWDTAPHGTVRVSLAYTTTDDDLQALVTALNDICNSL